MEKILSELRSLAAIEQPKNKSVAAAMIFEHCKIILLLKKHNPFAEWLRDIGAIIDEDVMGQCGLIDYVNNDYIMLNPRVLGTLQRQYLFFAFPRTAMAFQTILNKHGIDSLIVEIDMPNSTYGTLIGWPWAFL